MYYTVPKGFLYILLFYVSISVGQYRISAQGAAENSFNLSQKLTELVLTEKKADQSFELIQPFTTVPQSLAKSQYQDVVKDAIFLEIQPDILANVLKNNNQPTFTLRIPMRKGSFVDVELVEVINLDAEFKILTPSGPLSYTQSSLGRFFRGICKDKPGSLAAFTFFEDRIVGMFSDEEGNSIIAPTADAAHHILYNDEDLLMKMPSECHADIIEQPIQSRGDKDQDENAGFFVERCLKVFMEVDHALFLNKGSELEAVRYIASVFNNVAAIYQNESITLVLSEVFVWNQKDPYSTTSAPTALNQFKSLRPTFNGTIAHLAALGGKSLGGVAWLDVLCFQGFSYGYSNIHADYRNIPLYSWTVQVIAHEIGHNLGSRHTQWCGWPGGPIDDCVRPEGNCERGPSPQNGGTIMSYCHLTSNGINFANGFGFLPGGRMRNRVSNASCIESCYLNDNPICTRPNGLKVDNIQAGKAALSWIPSNQVKNYTVTVSVQGDSLPWKTLKVDTTMIQLEDLQDDVYYSIQILAHCDSATTSDPSALFVFYTGKSDEYCISKGQSSRQQWISLVEISNLTRSSGDDNGYFNGTDMIATVEPGKTFILKYKSDNSIGTLSLHWNIWIDWNGDGIFEGNEELVLSRISNTSNPLARAIRVPSNVKPGKVRMRVALKFGSYPGPCEQFGEGEVEDYTIEIVPVQNNLSQLDPSMDDAQAEPVIISVYPNPVVQDLILHYKNGVGETGELVVINQLGKIVSSERVTSHEGSNYHVMPLGDYLPGTYVLRLQIGNRVMQHKFVKI
jgi:hypothetical protein